MRARRSSSTSGSTRSSTRTRSSSIVCPVIAIVAQIYAIYLLFKNIHAIAGTISYADQIWWIAIVGVVIAAAYAFYLKTTNREKYDLVGRVIDEGIVP